MPAAADRHAVELLQGHTPGEWLHERSTLQTVPVRRYESSLLAWPLLLLMSGLLLAWPITTASLGWVQERPVAFGLGVALFFTFFLNALVWGNAIVGEDDTHVFSPFSVRREAERIVVVREGEDLYAVVTADAWHQQRVEAEVEGLNRELHVTAKHL